MLLFSRFQKTSVALFNLSRFDGRIDDKDSQPIVGLEPEPMWDGCPSCHGDASLPVSLCVVSLLSCFACWTCVKCRINKCLRHIWNFKYNLLVHWRWLSLLGNRGFMVQAPTWRVPWQWGEAPNPGVHNPHKWMKQPRSCRNNRLTSNYSSPATGTANIAS